MGCLERQLGERAFGVFGGFDLLAGFWLWPRLQWGRWRSHLGRCRGRGSLLCLLRRIVYHVRVAVRR